MVQSELGVTKASRTKQLVRELFARASREPLAEPRATSAESSVLGLRTQALALLVAAALVRLFIAWASIGSNDILTWERFARHMDEHGLAWMYQHELWWNHPPLMGYMAAALWRLSRALGWRFAVTFKLVPITADVSSSLLLAWIWLRRTGSPRAGLAALAVFGFSLNALLVSAYHGNTDSLLAFLILAAFTAADLGYWSLAGLLLGAAVNVKLIPLILAPLLVAHCRRWRDLFKFALGFALLLIPFVPVIRSTGGEFYKNAFSYNSQFNTWGMPLLIKLSRFVSPAIGGYGSPVQIFYVWVGRYLILASICAIAAYSRWFRPLSAYERGALGLAVFLVLAPGFSVQYTAQLGPLLVAASLSWGALWGLLAGLYLGLIYAVFWTHDWPLNSHFHDGLPPLSIPFGALAWLSLVAFVVWRLHPRFARSESA